MSRLHIFRDQHRAASLAGERALLLRYLRDAEGVLRSQGHDQATFVATGRQSLEQAHCDLAEIVSELWRVDKQLAEVKERFDRQNASYNDLWQRKAAVTHALSKVPLWVRRIFGAHHV